MYKIHGKAYCIKRKIVFKIEGKENYSIIKEIAGGRRVILFSCIFRWKGR